MINRRLPELGPDGRPTRLGPEAIVLSAIRANPVTAPYAIAATWKKGAVVLSGRVGTGVIHDMAVRTVIDLGYPVRDDLVIDTAEAHRVALARAYAEADGREPEPPTVAVRVGPLFCLSSSVVRQG